MATSFVPGRCATMTLVTASSTSAAQVFRRLYLPF